MNEPGSPALPTVFNKLGFNPKFEFIGSTKKDTNLFWKDISYKIGEKSILTNVTGQVEAGTVCALMGPSGAGKTSLMNILSGRVLPGKKSILSGDVFVNSKPVNPVQFRRKIAYVMQEDMLFETATARESLEFSARLRLPVKIVKDKVALNKIIDDLIESLGLIEVQHTMIGNEFRRGLSGGEKKRVSIGVELVSQPSVLFLDEPTSGLDSIAAWKVVKILEALGKTTGCAILCTIHQPSSEIFLGFEKVMMLSNGRVMYNGKVKDISSVFRQLGKPIPELSNPADFLMLLAQTSTSDKRIEYNVDEEFKDAMKKEDVGVKDEPSAVKIKRIGMLEEAYLLAKREVLNLKRNFFVLIIEAFIAFFLSIVFGIIFQGVADRSKNTFQFGNAFGAIILVINNSFFGAFQGPLIEFPLQRAVFLREYRTGTYSAFSYFFSKLLVELPRSLINPFVSWLTTYFLIGFEGDLFVFILIAWGLALTIASYAYCLGALFSDPEQAQQAAPLVLVPQLLFSGLFAGLDVIPSYISWVQYLCVLKYAINLAALEEFNNCDFSAEEESRFNKTDELLLSFGEVCEVEVLQRNDIDPDNTLRDVVALVAIFIGFRSLALFLLVLRSYRY